MLSANRSATPTNRYKNIQVIGLDSLGCIFNPRIYREARFLNDPVGGNYPLIHQWYTQIEALDETSRPDLIVFTLFSREQSEKYHRELCEYQDPQTGNKVMPFYNAVELICITINQLLASKGIHIPCVINASLLGEAIDDKSKLLICYHQIQSIASKYPEANTFFKLYSGRDTSSPPEKSNGSFALLTDFFTAVKLANVMFIPSNVTLQLFQYTGDLTVPKSIPIKGTGQIDFTYRNTLRLIVKIATGVTQIDARHLDHSFNLCEIFLHDPLKMNQLRKAVLNSSPTKELSTTKHPERIENAKKFQTSHVSIANAAHLRKFRPAMPIVDEKDENEKYENVLGH